MPDETLLGGVQARSRNRQVEAQLGKAHGKTTASGREADAFRDLREQNPRERILLCG